MRPLWARPTAQDAAVALVAAAATVFASLMAVRAGAQLSVGALLAIALFAAAVGGFVSHPHVTVAFTVVIFALIPALKVFVSPEIGALKDLLVVAGAIAAILLYVFERERAPDRTVGVLVFMLLGLYVLNVRGEHDFAWLQGIRLVGEPLILLLVGMTLRDPRRTARWALGALVLTCCLVAAYGLYQQVVGKYTLVEWGYSFESQVRSLEGGQFRSFGTLDDPFAYAALLCFGLAALTFWFRRGFRVWAASALITVGLALSFVRTSGLILVFFGGLLLRRWGLNVSAALVVAASLLAGAAILVNASGSQSQVYPVIAGDPTSGTGGSTANVILNGRISAWQAAVGDNPVDWALGRGVGEVGTAAARATYTLAPSTDTPQDTTVQAVDSGYLATLADVGVFGLALLLLLFWRLITLGWSAASEGSGYGWVALALLAALLLDAVTRASFTGFPTAFLGLLLIGLCLSAAEDDRGAPATAG